MKDLMQDMMEAGRGAVAVTVAMLIAAVLVYGSGCAGAHKGHGHNVKAPSKAMAKAWKPGKRCKLVGRALTTHVAVRVQKDCFKAGVTTVGIVVLNSEKKGTVAADHAAQAIVAILGFKPALAMIVASKHKQYPFMLAAVVDSATAPVARKGR